MTEPPNKTDSITVDELLGMAYDACARARSSPDASTKQNLTQVADGFLKQAKEMRRRCNSNDRFSSEPISERPPRGGLSISATARMSAFDPKRTLSLDAPMSDWSCNPILAGKRSDLDALDDAALHRRVEILHRLLIKVDDAPWLERPNIIYFDDRSLVCRFDEREPRAIGLS